MNNVASRIVCGLGLLAIATAVTVRHDWAKGGTLVNLGAMAIGPRDVPPRVETDLSEWDFGHVSAGNQLEASFPVRNVGGRRLILLEQSSSCPCASGGRPEIIIPPGEQRNLAAKLDTTDLAGSLQLELRYRTNDVERPVLTLVLLADVTPP